MRMLPVLALPATPAAAHPGHIADLAGHDHWTLGTGLGAIAAAALLGWLKGGKRAKDEATEDDAADTPDAPEEQPA